MKKVMIITSAIDVGGAQRFCLNLTKYLNSINFDYEMVFLRKSKSEKLKQEFCDNKINFVELNAKSVMRAVPSLVKHIKKSKPDIMVCTIGNVDFAVSLAKKLSRTKARLAIRKANVVFDDQKNKSNLKKLRFESKAADMLVALTEEMKLDYQQYGFTGDKTTVIYNMVDIDYIKGKISSSKGDEHPWFNDKKGKIIIANGRFVPEKRYDVMIKAFYEIFKSSSETRFMILGDGKLREEIEGSVPDEMKENIDFLGFRDNPYYYMKNSDLFLHASDYEGFPNVLIEAFACGLPVISTDSKTGPKEIIKNGHNGFVVDRGDYKALAQRALSVLSDDGLLCELSKNAEADAENYTVDKIAKKYIELFECL